MPLDGAEPGSDPCVFGRHDGDGTNAEETGAPRLDGDSDGGSGVVERLTLAIESALPLGIYSRAPSARALFVVEALYHRHDPNRGDGADGAGEGSKHVGIDPCLLCMPSATFDADAARMDDDDHARQVVHANNARAYRAREACSLARAILSLGARCTIEGIVASYLQRMALGRARSLRRRVAALGALYAHVVGPGRCPPPAIESACTSAAGVELAAAWFAKWSESAGCRPPACPVDPYGCVAPSDEDAHPTCIPVAWLPVVGNTAVPLGGGAGFFYVGYIDDPTACPVHRDGPPPDVDACLPHACPHARALSALGNASASTGPWTSEVRRALLADMVAVDATSTAFALRARAAVNTALNRPRPPWEGPLPGATGAFVDLFTECVVDVFVLARVDALGRVLPHAVAVAPRFDLEPRL